MKSLLFAAAVAAMAFEPDPRIWRLLSDHPSVVTGIDRQRLSNTKLESRIPMDFLPASASTAGVRGVIVFQFSNGSELTVLCGQVSKDLLAHYEGYGSVSPAPGIVFLGHAPSLRYAMQLWNHPSPPVPEWAGRIRDLASSFDNWAFLQSPFDPDFFSQHSLSSLLQLPAEKIRNVALGIRLGNRHRFFVSAAAGSDADAIVAAALAPWLPTLIKRTGLLDPDLVDLASDIDTRRNGRVVEISGAIDDSKIQPAPHIPELQ